MIKNDVIKVFKDLAEKKIKFAIFEYGGKMGVEIAYTMGGLSSAVWSSQN